MEFNLEMSFKKATKGTWVYSAEGEHITQLYISKTAGEAPQKIIVSVKGVIENE